jgi:hypothetical protein
VCKFQVRFANSRYGLIDKRSLVKDLKSVQVLGALAHSRDSLIDKRSLELVHFVDLSPETSYR